MSPAKRIPEELAILGGEPAFSRPLHVGLPAPVDLAALHEQATRILGRRRFTNDGPCVRELEGRIAARLGVGNCVATSSATTGLQVLLQALEVEGPVLMPSFTFVATAHAARWLGADPVFCDIDPVFHTVDPGSVRARARDGVAAIVGVHLWGNVCPVEELEAIAASREVPLIFDAAHAFDCEARGVRVGSFGRAEVLSFHATKIFHTFEGGAITTDDDDLADRCRRLRNFGFAGEDRVVALGTNAKMHELTAAIGLVQLRDVEARIERARANRERVRQALSGLPGLALVASPVGVRGNGHNVVLTVDADVAGVRRDDLHRALRAENVLARRYFHPGCHRLEPYATSSPGHGRWLPETERVCDRVLSLPNGDTIGEREIESIVAVIRIVCRHPETLGSGPER